MTDQTDNNTQNPAGDEADNDARADRKAILVMFVTAVLMAVHFVSGFTFDF